jgi:molybdate transport system substrate-binding protein
MRSFIAVLCLAVASNAAAQQTLTVGSSNATKALIQELGPVFEKRTGWTLDVKFDNSAALKARMETGENVDVAVMTASAINDLAASGRLTRESRADVARAGVGMAIHPQATSRISAPSMP